MQAERDHLVRVVFPRLRRDLLAYRVHLVDIDLRWGVTSEQDAASLCRDVIDECRPHFICMLGGRYGWVPPGSIHSITADEIYHGVLNQDPIVSGYAWFYFRKQEATLLVDPVLLPQYEEQPGSLSAQALVELKSAISNAGFVPRHYDATWDREAKRLTGLFEFGAHVYSDLKRTILSDSGLNVPGIDEGAEREDAAVDVYLENRLNGFVLGSRNELASKLLRHARRGASPYLLLQAEPGCGKSSFLAYVANELASQADETLNVISHFVGASSLASDPEYTIRWLCAAMGRTASAADAGLAHSFKLAVAAVKQPLVVIIDGVDGFLRTGNVPSSSWLAVPVPDHVRFILSTNSANVTNELRSAGARLESMTLPQLDRSDRRLITLRFLTRYGKTLSAEQQRALEGKAAAGLPLYLTAALEELRTLGTYEEISARINALPDDTQALFSWIFRRLENDDEFRDEKGTKIGPELVAATAALLSASRDGLSEDELTALLEYNLLGKSKSTSRVTSGVDSSASLPGDLEGNLSALLLLLRPYLISRRTLLDFNHDQIKAAATALYIQRDDQTRSTHNQLAAYFLAQLRAQVTSEPSRAGRELLYHLRCAGQWQQIISCLADTHLFERIPPSSYGLEYSVGTFGGVDSGGVSPSTFKGADGAAKAIARSLADLFAMRAQEKLELANSFPKPWSMTASILRKNNEPAFQRFRDTFYDFTGLVSLAFAFAVVSCDTPTDAGRFLSNWQDIVQIARDLDRSGHELTGLSHAIEDQIHSWHLDALAALSAKGPYEFASSEIRGLDSTFDDENHRAVGSKKQPVSVSQDVASFPETRRWMEVAQPTLDRISATFDSMRYDSAAPEPDVQGFTNSIKRLVGELPPLPSGPALQSIKPALEAALNRRLHHGRPIPDDYDFQIVLVENGALWEGDVPVEQCLRVGLFCVKSVREGYGEMTTGMIVEPEVIYHNGIYR
jgi:hypothetical protein